MSNKNHGTATAVLLTLGAGAILGAGVWWVDRGDALLPGLFVLIPCLLGQWWTMVRLRRVESDLAGTGSGLEESRGKALAGLKEELVRPLADLRQSMDAFPARLQTLAGDMQQGREELLRRTAADANVAAASLARLEEKLEAFQGGLQTLTGEMRVGQEASLRRAAADDVKADRASAAAAEIRASVDAGLATVKAELQTVRGEVSAVGASLEETQRKTLDEMRGQIEGSVRQSVDAAARNFQDIVTIFNVSHAAWKEEAEAREGRVGALAGETAALLSAVRHAVDGIPALLDAGAKATQEDVRRVAAHGAEQLVEAGAGLRRTADGVAAALDAGVQGAAERLQAHAAQAGDTAGSVWANQFGRLEEMLAGFAERAEAVQAAVAESNEGARQTRDAALKLIGDLEEKLAESARAFEARDRLNLELDGKVAALAEQTLRGTREMGDLAHESRISQTEMHAGVAMLNAGLNSLLERLETQAQAGRDQQGLLTELSRGLAEFQERSAEILMENAMKTQEVLMDVLHLAERKNDSGSELPPLERMAAVS